MIHKKSILFLAVAVMVFTAAYGCRAKKAEEAQEQASQEQKLTASAGEESGVEETGEAGKEKAAPGQPAGGQETGAQGGKKVLMVIACDRFRDEELGKPKELFEKEGMAVTVASNKKEGCKGMMGGGAKVDALVGDVSAKDFDAVVFVGGVGAKVFFDDPEASKLAQDAAGGGKVVAAICIAPSILAKAGVLKGKRATVWEGKEFTDVLKEGGCTYSGESVTVDGNVVTANGPGAAPEFGRRIIDLLKK
jgi:protease I